MADFRRWITALAMLALLVGVAGAQTQVCNSVAQVTPTLRSEGITELVGDIVITCTGGRAQTPGTPIPQANLTVSLTAPVTSRLSSSSADSGVSEALLLIDEPNSPGIGAIVPGFGPEAQLNVCTSTSGGCIEYATQVNATIGGASVPVVVATDVQGPLPGNINPGKNVFLGVVGGQQVSFNGIPVLPPATTGVSRVYRITNIRINASGAGSSVVSGVQPVYAYLSASGSASLPVSNAALTVGFVQTSLKTSVNSNNRNSVATSTTINTFTQCDLTVSDVASTTPVDSAGAPLQNHNVAILNFTENFPSAFKTRVGTTPTGVPTGPTGSPSSYLGTTAAGSYAQNLPGQIYNSESGFILNVPFSSSSNFAAGLANSGTRFQANFTGLPSGAKIYVSLNNVKTSPSSSQSAFTLPFDNPNSVAIGGVPTSPNISQPAIAVLTTGGVSGAFAAYSVPSGSSAVMAYGSSVQVVPLTVTNGAATAVWEVTNTNSSGNETFAFAVYMDFTPNLTNNLPTPGNAAAVHLSYAPIGVGSLPANPNWIPRFSDPNPSSTSPLLNIVACQTVLLFPYVTSQGGFDTGIAISNTSLDPISTQTSAGTCTLNFYGASAPTAAISVPSSTHPEILTFANGTASAPVANATTIPAGGQMIFSTGTVIPNFQGYMFATCNFQYAHGFAFVSDIGARNLAMGYLALVVNNGVQLNQRAGGSMAYQGEALSQ